MRILVARSTGPSIDPGRQDTSDRSASTLRELPSHGSCEATVADSRSIEGVHFTCSASLMASAKASSYVTLGVLWICRDTGPPHKAGFVFRGFE